VQIPTSNQKAYPLDYTIISNNSRLTLALQLTAIVISSKDSWKNPRITRKAASSSLKRLSKQQSNNNRYKSKRNHASLIVSVN